MKARGAAIQGGLAALALLVAYFTWQREPDRGGNEEVEILELGKSDVAAVRFDDRTKWVRLERRGDETWMTYGVKAPPPDAGVIAMGAADGGVADAGAAIASAPAFDAGPSATLEPVAPKLSEREVKTNELGDRLLERFGPLLAQRALGTLPPEKLTELGLTDSPRWLEVEARGTKYRFHVSAVTPTGGAPYVRDERNGDVFLINASIIADLDSASTRLLDRRVHLFKQTEYSRALVKSGGRERAYLSMSEPGEQPKVAAEATPTKQDEFARNWLDKVFRLVPMDVLGKGEEPPTGAPEVEARVEYSRKGTPVGWIEFGRSGPNILYLRSEHTAGWVRAQLGAKEVLDDAKKLAEGT